MPKDQGPRTEHNTTKSHEQKGEIMRDFWSWQRIPMSEFQPLYAQDTLLSASRAQNTTCPWMQPVHPSTLLRKWRRVQAVQSSVTFWGNPCIARALRAHCALLLDYVPPEEPLGAPLGNILRIRQPKLDWRGP